MPSEVELAREASQVSLIVVKGAPGTGKPTVAAALAASLGWSVDKRTRGRCAAPALRLEPALLVGYLG